MGSFERYDTNVEKKTDRIIKVNKIWKNKKDTTEPI